MQKCGSFEMRCKDRGITVHFQIIILLARHMVRRHREGIEVDIERIIFDRLIAEER
jgi:hypothetical protein